MPLRRKKEKPPQPRPVPGSAEDLASQWFRGKEIADAAAALRTIEPDPRDTDPTRVWRACLVLSKGRLKDLHHYVQQARLDFRDVLYWAESCDS